MDDDCQADTQDGESIRNVDASFAEGRKCTAFVLNVAEEMFVKNETNGGELYIKTALRRVRDFLNHLAVMSSLQEFVAVIFMNAPEKYSQGIHTMYKTDNVTAELVMQLNELLEADNFKAEFEEQFGAGSAQSDINDAISTGRACCSEINVRQKRIIFYSRNYDPYDDDDQYYDRLSKQIASIETSIHITASLVDLNIGEVPVHVWDIVDPTYKARYIDDSPLTEYFEMARRASSRLPFILGDKLEIAVGVFVLINERKKPRFEMMQAQSNEPVKRQAYFVNREIDDAAKAKKDEEKKAKLAVERRARKAAKNGTETNDGDDANGRDVDDNEDAMDADDESNRKQFANLDLFYKTTIGGRDIVLSHNEKAALQQIEGAAIHLVGFKPMRCLKDSHRMGPSTYIYPLDDLISGSRRLYKALLDACLRRNIFALARVAYRNNHAPKLCALIPQANSQGAIDHTQNIRDLYRYEGFHAVELPYRQSKRSMQKEYETDTRRRGDFEAPVLPAVENFVRRLTRPYVPDQFSNADLKRHYTMVECLALKDDKETCERKLAVLSKFEPFYEKASVSQVESDLDSIKRIIEDCDADAESLKRGRKRAEKVNAQVRATGPAPKRGRGK